MRVRELIEKLSQYDLEAEVITDVVVEDWTEYAHVEVCEKPQEAYYDEESRLWTLSDEVEKDKGVKKHFEDKGLQKEKVVIISDGYYWKHWA